MVNMEVSAKDVIDVFGAGPSGVKLTQPWCIEMIPVTVRLPILVVTKAGIDENFGCASIDQPTVHASYDPTRLALCMIWIEPGCMLIKKRRIE